VTATGVADRWTTVAGVRLHYLAAGDSDPPVLLLHGGGVDAAGFSFHAAIPALAACCRVLAPDWPGYGGSASPPTAWALAEHVALLGGLLDALGLARASLVGLSLGGGAALGFALQAPERVERLVLVDSYGLGEELLGGVVSYLFVHSPLNRLSWAALRLLARTRRLARLTLRATLPRHPERVTEPLLDAFIRLLRQPRAGAAWRQFQRRETLWLRYRASYLQQLPDLRVPTLLIHGANDPAVPVAWAERAHGRIPGSQLVVLPECGHVAPMEQPDACNAALLRFLAAGVRS